MSLFSSPTVVSSVKTPHLVQLARPLRDALERGHPWVYREALRAMPDLPSGSVVDLFDRQGFVARGLLDRSSPLAVRVFTLRPDEPIDEELVARRLARAFDLRRRTIPGIFTETTGYRLCHGEGDHLPGVVIDVYGPVAVVVFDGEAAATLRQAVVRCFASNTQAWSLTTLIERHQRRQGHGHDWLYGPPPALPEKQRGRHPLEWVYREHGMHLLVDVENGQKTGTYLDQRENRRFVRSRAAGLSVWNGFCYTGGFSVAAALGGATRVVSVDRQAAAIETARRNFALSGLPMKPHDFLVQDVFVALRAAKAAGERFDWVIVDPPSFAPTEAAVPQARLAYQRLVAQALDIVTPGGFLSAASCSSHVDEEAFLSAMCDGARVAGRALRFLEIRGQPGDHPTLPAFPEGRYLKFTFAAA